MTSPYKDSENKNKIIYRLCSKGEIPYYPYKAHGLSDPEEGHIWSEGYEVSFSFPIHIEDKRVKAIVFKNTSACISSDHIQTTYVCFNGILTNIYTYNINSPIQDVSLLVPPGIKEIIGNISFKIPNACLASVVDKNNNDPRILGISFNNIELIFDDFSDVSIGSFYRLASGGTLAATLPVYPFEIQGMSYSEKTHRWTDSKLVRFIIPLSIENSPVRSMIFRNTTGLVSPNCKQELIISVNNHIVDKYIYDVKTPSRTIEVKISDKLPHIQTDNAVVCFELPNANLASLIDPNNSDPRILGLSLNEIGFLTEADMEKQEEIKRQAVIKQAAIAAEARHQEARRIKHRQWELDMQRQRNEKAMREWRDANLQADGIRRFSNPNFNPCIALPINGMFTKPSWMKP